jgi:hypothetical protein
MRSVLNLWSLESHLGWTFAILMPVALRVSFGALPPISAGCQRGQGYIGLSPFTRWRIDFDLKGNEWLDWSVIKTVALTFERRTLGPGRRLV